MNELEKFIFSCESMTISNNKQNSTIDSSINKCKESISSIKIDIDKLKKKIVSLNHELENSNLSRMEKEFINDNIYYYKTNIKILMDNLKNEEHHIQNLIKRKSDLHYNDSSVIELPKIKTFGIDDKTRRITQLEARQKWLKNEIDECLNSSYMYENTKEFKKGQQNKIDYYKKELENNKKLLMSLNKFK